MGRLRGKSAAGYAPVDNGTIGTQAVSSFAQFGVVQREVCEFCMCMHPFIFLRVHAIIIFFCVYMQYLYSFACECMSFILDYLAFTRMQAKILRVHAF